MSGLTRQEMKRDEVQEQLLVGVGWLQEHWQKLVAGIVALFVLVIAIGVFLMIRDSGAEKAQAALGSALDIHTAPILEDGATPDDERNRSFASEEERATRSQAAFEALLAEHGGSDAAPVAHLILGEIAASGGDLEGARTHWQDAARGGSGTALEATARLNLISLDRQERPQELVAELQDMVDRADTTLPADALLFELAQTQEAVGELEAAQENYQRLIDEFGTSPYTVQARERVQG